MICRVHQRSHAPRFRLAEALGRPVSPDEALTEHTVVAHWSGLDACTPDDEQTLWRSTQWAEHLEDPYLEHPFAVSPDNDRLAILHIDVRLHPDDRELTGPEWSETAHRLARVVGVEVPGEDGGCRWIAVQAQPGRLDLIANLIRLDGAWQPQPADLPQRLADEARRIEHDLRLTRVPVAPQQSATVRAAPTAAAQFAAVLTQLADEQDGPLAAVRALVEHTAHRIARQPGAERPGTAHRLEWIARRLYGIQQDLDATATTLRQAAGPTASLPLMPTASPPVPGARSPR